MGGGRGPRRSRGFDRDMESSSSSIVEAIFLPGAQESALDAQWRFLRQALALRETLFWMNATQLSIALQGIEKDTQPTIKWILRGNRIKYQSTLIDNSRPAIE